MNKKLPLEYYLDAIARVQRQLSDLDRPINVQDLYGYFNLLLQAKREYPQYFLDINVKQRLQGNKLLGWYCSPKSLPFDE